MGFETNASIRASFLITPRGQDHAWGVGGIRRPPSMPPKVWQADTKQLDEVITKNYLRG